MSLPRQLPCVHANKGMPISISIEKTEDQCIIQAKVSKGNPELGAFVISCPTWWNVIYFRSIDASMECRIVRPDLTALSLDSFAEEYGVEFKYDGPPGLPMAPFIGFFAAAIASVKGFKRKQIMYDAWLYQRDVLNHLNPRSSPEVIANHTNYTIESHFPDLYSDGPLYTNVATYHLQPPEGNKTPELLEKTRRLADTVFRIDPSWDGESYGHKWRSFVHYMDTTILPALTQRQEIKKEEEGKKTFLSSDFYP